MVPNTRLNLPLNHLPESPLILPGIQDLIHKPSLLQLLGGNLAAKQQHLFGLADSHALHKAMLAPPSVTSPSEANGVR